LDCVAQEEGINKTPAGLLLAWFVILLDHQADFSFDGAEGDSGSSGRRMLCQPTCRTGSASASAAASAAWNH